MKPLSVIRRRWFLRSASRALLLVLAASGCGPTPGLTLLESKVLPPPRPPSPGQGLLQAYSRSQLNDPRLRALAEEFQTWALQQRAGGAGSAPLFSRVEVLPPVLTVLPYGVGAYEQEPRLPVILTTGPGWTAQEPGEKEARTARLFGELSQRLSALTLHPPLRPTLTIQTASGLELSWINDLVKGRGNVHGDEELTPATQPPPPAPPAPRPVERETSLHGDEH